MVRGGLSIGPDGFLYAANFGVRISSANGRNILKINPKDGKFVEFGKGLSGATGNAFDAKGNLYQLSYMDNALYKYAPNGESTFVAEITDGLIRPLAIDINKNGDLFIANCGMGTVIKINNKGESEVYAQDDHFKCANGLAIDHKTNLIYVVNFKNGDVLEISEQGTVKTIATLPSGSNSQIKFNDGVLYVASGKASVVYSVKPSGEFEVFLGDGVEKNTDGKLNKAQINNPNDIVFGEDGKIYILAKSDNAKGAKISPSVIRVITPATN